MIGWPRRKTRIIIYLIILAGTTLYFGISLYNDYYPPTKPIERFFDFTIPQTATDVQAYYEWVFQGGHFYLQFKLPAQDFEAFKRAVCSDGELSTDYNQRVIQFRSSDAPEWWLTDPASITVSTRCLQGRFIDLMVDRSDEAVYTIYMDGSLG